MRVTRIPRVAKMLPYSSPITPAPTMAMVRGSSAMFRMSSLRRMRFPSTFMSLGRAGDVPTATTTLSVVIGWWPRPFTGARSMVWASTKDASAVMSSTLFRMSWSRSVSLFCCMTWLVRTVRSLMVMSCLTE